MTKNNSFSDSKVSTRHLLVVGVIASALVLALPVLASAATFAYVNQAGDVATVTADSATMAMVSALNIDEHSGVMLLTNPADGIVGDHVPGV